ncbi:MAG: hypothetical protein R6V77_01730 [Candidatus Cloacimonadaceae bacterium]
MRYSLPILILLLVLTGCASQKFMADKGVFYPKEETAKLDGLTRFNIPVMDGAAGNMLTSGDMQFLDGRAFLPVIVTSKSGSDPFSHSVIYAMDGDSGAILDSLVLRQDEYMKFFALVADKHLFIVGEQDTLLHIIKADKELNIIQRYPVDLEFKQIYYAGTAHDKLRIVVSDEQSNMLMYEFRTEDLTLERTRLLAKGQTDDFQYSVEGNFLWALRIQGNLLSTVRFDLIEMDPDPDFKEFMFPADMQSKFKAEVACTAGNYIYLSYWEKDDPKDAELITESKVIALDYDKETSAQKGFESFPTDFHIRQVDENVYFYAMQFDPKKAITTYTISRATPDLQDFSQVIRFLESDRKVRFFTKDDSVFKLYENGGKLYFTGFYYQNWGKLKAGDTYLFRTSDNYKVQPQVFSGIYTPAQ